MPNEAHIIALAGNPNVGKSTVFNALTGLRQHTGNWPGKTVAAARGDLTYGGERFTLVDLPGTYSLFPNSAEEEIARDYLCSGEAEAVLILADATCLERSLNLVLQTLEAADVPAVVCVNLLDEAAKKGIVLDLPALSRALGVPVGFVNVVESKELIIEGGRAPYIVARGRKGGSNVAAAICNALLYQIRR